MTGLSRVLDSAAPPEDKFQLAYWIFFSLGAGFLYPWNAFITAADYFGALYPAAHVDRVFPVAYMVPNIIFLTLLIKYGGHYSPTSRIYLGFTFFLIILLGMPLLDLLVVQGGQGTALSLVVTVAAIAFTGFVDAIVQGSLFGLAGELPASFTQALEGGTSASGLIVSLLRCFTKAAFPANHTGMRLSAWLYFSVSSLFVAGCLLSFRHLAALPIVMHYQTKKLGPRLNPSLASSQDQDEASAPKSGPVKGEEEGSSLLDAQLANSSSSEKQEALQDRVVDSASFRDVWGKIWKDTLLVMLVNWVTLAIFPGFLAENVHSAALGDWYPVILITFFNLFDFVGKMGPTRYIISDGKVQIATFLRLLFFPAFIVCLKVPSLATEPVVSLLTCSLGLSNGYLTSILMMFAPKRVNLHEAATAGTIMVFFLVLGLMLGAFTGWLWVI